MLVRKKKSKRFLEKVRVALDSGEIQPDNSLVRELFPDRFVLSSPMLRELERAFLCICGHQSTAIH